MMKSISIVVITTLVACVPLRLAGASGADDVLLNKFLEAMRRHESVAPEELAAVRRMLRHSWPTPDDLVRRGELISRIKASAWTREIEPIRGYVARYRKSIVGSMRDHLRDAWFALTLCDLNMEDGLRYQSCVLGGTSAAQERFKHSLTTGLSSQESKSLVWKMVALASYRSWPVTLQTQAMDPLWKAVVRKPYRVDVLRMAASTSLGTFNELGLLQERAMVVLEAEAPRLALDEARALVGLIDPVFRNGFGEDLALRIVRVVVSPKTTNKNDVAALLHYGSVQVAGRRLVNLLRVASDDGNVSDFARLLLENRTGVADGAGRDAAWWESRLKRLASGK